MKRDWIKRTIAIVIAIILALGVLIPILNVFVFNAAV